MEEPGSPAAVKAKEQTQSMLFTYFQGDINSVVDEHFSRALNRANKPKDLSTKGKSSGQPPKSEAAPLQWSLPASPWSEAAFPSPPSGRIQFAPSEDPHSSLRALASPSAQPSDPWSFPPRPSTSFGLPQMAYAQPMLTEDPGPAERQYSNSFLNLLHGDRQAGRAPLGPSTKPDLGPGWTAPAGFREPLGSGIVLDSGIQVAEKKKDLYWY